MVFNKGDKVCSQKRAFKCAQSLKVQGNPWANDIPVLSLVKRILSGYQD